ncbi:High mobility group protein B1 [Manis javanica]|nr:High mobility group protein B1 [Manis javanica]
MKTRQRQTRPVMEEKRKHASLLSGNKRQFKDPSTPRGLQPFSSFGLSIAQKLKENIPLYPLVTLQRNWEMQNNGGAGGQQPHGKKAAKLKEKYGKDTAAYQAEGKPDASKMGVARLKKARKRRKMRRRRKMKMVILVSWF